MNQTLEVLLFYLNMLLIAILLPKLIVLYLNQKFFEVRIIRFAN